MELEVETFPNYSGECTDRIFSFEKDLTVADYLKSDGATLLRDAYVAYLVNEDLNFIRYMDANEIEQELPKLKSMSEFNFFRGTEKAELSLLSKEGLSKFFPKYSGKEYYFTGMFMNNLLWTKKSKDRRGKSQLISLG